MTQIDTNTYTVSRREEVTVVLVAHEVICSAAVFSVGGNVPNQPDPCRYVWTVTRPVGQRHIGVVVCRFPAGSPDGAMFEISFNGFKGPTIRKSQLPHEERFEFRVM